jgi:hypothetical protein
LGELPRLKEQLWFVRQSFRESAGLIGSEAYFDGIVLQSSKFGTAAATIHTQTIHGRLFSSQQQERQLTTN